MVDLRKNNEQRVSNSPISIKPKNRDVWLLFDIYWSAYIKGYLKDKNITKGEFIEQLLKKEIKEKFEKGDFSLIEKNRYLLK